MQCGLCVLQLTYTIEQKLVLLTYTINVKLPRIEETWSTVSIRRYSTDHRYAYENISSISGALNYGSLMMKYSTSFGLEVTLVKLRLS